MGELLHSQLILGGGEESDDQKGKGELVVIARGRERRANLGELLLALGKGNRKKRGERRAEEVPAAPRLLGYPLGFPLTFTRDKQGARAATVLTRRSESEWGSGHAGPRRRLSYHHHYYHPSI